MAASSYECPAGLGGPDTLTGTTGVSQCAQRDALSMSDIPTGLGGNIQDALLQNIPFWCLTLCCVVLMVHLLSQWFTSGSLKLFQARAQMAASSLSDQRGNSQETLLQKVLPFTVLDMLLRHEDENLGPWRRRGHWLHGLCGQSCGCCRSHNPEDFFGCCEPCHDGWPLTTVSSFFYGAVRQYAAQYSEKVGLRHNKRYKYLDGSYRPRGS